MAINNDIVFTLFEAQLHQNNMHINSIDEEGYIYVSKDDILLKIDLENTRRDYERDGNTEVIDSLIEALVSYSDTVPDEWENARNDIYLTFYPADVLLDNILYHNITPGMNSGYVYCSQEKQTYITHQDLERWNITEQVLHLQSNINAESLYDDAVKISNIEGHKLYFLETEYESLKGSILFSEAFKRTMERKIGFPYYVVFPVRDFWYVFSEDDFTFFRDKLADIVIEEYTGSGYPVTTEILRFDMMDVKAIGNYMEL